MEKQPHEEYRDELAGKLKEIRNSDPANPDLGRSKAQGYLDAKRETDEYQEAVENRSEYTDYEKLEDATEEERTKDFYINSPIEKKSDIEYLLDRVFNNHNSYEFKKEKSEWNRDWPNFNLESIPEDLLKSEDFIKALINRLEGNMLKPKFISTTEDDLIIRTIVANSIEKSDGILDYSNREMLVKLLSLAKNVKTLHSGVPLVGPYTIKGLYDFLEEGPFNINGEKFKRSDFEVEVEKLRKITRDKQSYKELGLEFFADNILHDLRIRLKALYQWSHKRPYKISEFEEYKDKTLKKTDEVFERMQNIGILKDSNLRDRLIDFINHAVDKNRDPFTSSSSIGDTFYQDSFWETFKSTKQELLEILKEAILDTEVE